MKTLFKSALQKTYLLLFIAFVFCIGIGFSGAFILKNLNVESTSTEENSGLSLNKTELAMYSSNSN